MRRCFLAEHQRSLLQFVAWALTLCTALVAWLVRFVGIKVGDASHPADEPRNFS